MNHTEIDAAVAVRVMGWHKHPTHPMGLWSLPNGDTAKLIDSWSPSTDWNDAAEVVEKMRQSKWCLILRTYPSGTAEKFETSYRAKFYSAVSAGTLGECTYDSAPLAICLAALKAVGTPTPNTGDAGKE
jgi:hypothetical protein